jgi:hypothetical protein
MLILPTDITHALIEDRPRDGCRVVDRYGLGEVLPSRPGLLQRLAFRAAGWGRPPAMMAGRRVAATSAL